jgi:hypothetical protein
VRTSGGPRRAGPAEGASPLVGPETRRSPPEGCGRRSAGPANEVR